MKSKKPDQDQPADNEEQEIEERVKRMLDPSQPDPKPEKPSFEIIPDAAAPSTAPEVKDEDIPAKLPKSITITMHDDEDDKLDEKTAKTEAGAPPVVDDTEEKKDEGDKKTDEEDADEPEADTAVSSKAIAVTDESEEATDIAASIGKPATEEVAEEVDVKDDDIETIELDEPETEDGEKAEDETEAEEDTAEDEKTDDVVDDIVTKESDELLEAEDEKIAKAFDDKKPSFGQRIKNGLATWWGNKTARRATIAAAVAGVVITLTVPVSRYFVLNTVGVRSAASVIVLDDSTGQPLKNVQVSMRGQSAVTDQDGVARLTGLKLGATELAIEKRAFAESRRTITLGWGSNPLGDFRLTPVGSQYAFTVRDFLSDKPITKVEAISGEASAFSDEEGKIKLTIDKRDDEPFEVRLVGTDLREEKLTISADDKSDHQVKMVPGRPHVFITKRAGKYDVYKIDIDGKSEKLLLAGTGRERDDMVIIPHPTDPIAALVSTRENARNKDGFLLSTLTVIDLNSGDDTKVIQSERVQIIDWVGDKLVFMRVVSGSSGGNPKRHRLVSYDYKTGNSKELASSNYFNDVVIARGVVYYAPSSAYQKSGVALFRVNADGSDRRTVLGRETWSIFRTDYDKLTLSTGQDWFDFFMADGATNKLPGEPSGLRGRLYADSPDRKHSLWVDQRDGKGVLLAYNIENRSDEEIHSRSGLRTPVRWLNNRTIVFRIKTDSESADYAVSVDGGEPKKIRDVTNTAGVDDWYYY